MKNLARFDGLGKVRMDRTQEGYLRGNAVVTRCGIFNYRRDDGSVIRELRHPVDVFDSESLNSLKQVPITVDHPSVKLLDATNAKELSVGMTGESITVRDGHVTASLAITDAQAIDMASRGEKVELSCGYTADVIEEAGIYDGQPYDTRQTNIRYNHLAMVDSARAGPNARLRMDSGDAILSQESRDMKKVKIDGIEYDAAPEVANALNRATADAEAARADAAKEKGRADGLQAKLDTATESLKKANDDLPKAINDGVAARMAILDTAAVILGDDLKLDSTNEELMRAVILKHAPDAKLDGKSAEYIQARFDSIAEVVAEDAAGAVRQAKGDGAAKGKGGKETKIDSNAARDRMVARMKGEKEDKGGK